MSIGYNPKIVMNGLVFCLDAANRKSYPGSGTTWSELKSKVTGTLTNGPTYSSTNNGAIVLDGVNDYVTFGSSFTTLDLTDKSLQCWIKKTGSGSGKGIIDKDFDNGAPNYGGWGFWIQSNNKLWWWNHANLDLLDDGPNTISTTTWTNVAVTYDNTSKTANFYINGVLNSSKTNASIVEKSSGSSLLVVGSTRDGSAFYFDGSISLILGYNRLLSAAEIQQNYESSRGRYSL